MVPIPVGVKQTSDALISINTGCTHGYSRMSCTCCRAMTTFNPAMELGALACYSWKVAANPS